ncbi:MAG: DUF4412 domain-containing protein [Candidatus Aminicenantes bacterium]|nr:MAG: DUF4412 domain-containing protein [Candidatus Aminicenantes bacterium]
MNKKVFFLAPAILVIIAFAFSPILANADHVIKGKKHTDAFNMMGQSQPEKDEETTTWLGKDKMKQDVGETTTLIRLDKNKMYIINHSDKTYSEMDLPFDLEQMLPPEAKQMLDAMDISSSITDTGETKTINDWNCKKYQIEISVSMMGMGMPINMDMWTSKDLGVDLKEFKELYTKTLAANPMFKDFIQDFEKIDGYPVLTEFSMDMMGTEQKYTEEVISVEKMGAPAGTYDLPEGYTKTTYNPFDQRR